MSIQELKPHCRGCLLILQSCWQELGQGESHRWFVVWKQEERSCWAARNLISGRSCFFHRGPAPPRTAAHAFWRGAPCTAHFYHIPEMPDFARSFSLCLMPANSHTSDRKHSDHPLLSSAFAFYFFIFIFFSLATGHALKYSWWEQLSSQQWRRPWLCMIYALVKVNTNIHIFL